MHIYFASVVHMDGTTSEGIVLAINPQQAENRTRNFIKNNYPSNQLAVDVAIIKAQEGRNTIQVAWIAGN